jgi:poly(A) polymerase
MTALNSKDYDITIPQSLLSLLKALYACLNESGIPGYIVGGFIRDAILKRGIDDIDIAIAADALECSPQLAQVVNGRSIPMDKYNRVARIILKSECGAAPQHVDVSTITGNIEDDLSRRDFAINAMAIPLEAVEDKISCASIIDPFSGLRDIEQKRIRTVSDRAFEADALRLLRAVRLSAEIGFLIENDTEALMKEQSSLIQKISGERVREELLKLLATRKTGDIFLYLEELGLLTALMPELTPSKGLAQPGEHYWDVFTHSVKTIDATGYILRSGEWEYDNEAIQSVPWSGELERYFNESISGGSTRLLLLKLAALLHDIAKPKTKFIDENGRIRFYGHPREGAPVAADIMEGLRFSNKEVRIVEEIVRHHLRPTQMTQMGMVTDHAIYRYFRDVGEVAIDTLFFTLADHLAARGPNLDLKNWREHTATVNYILEKHTEQKKTIIRSSLLNGNDIMNEFGLKPGPKIGELLEAVREAQASGEIVDRNDAMAYIEGLLNH